VRSAIKPIGFLLLLALWLPGLFGLGAGHESKVPAGPRGGAVYIQSSSVEAAPFHQLRLQKNSTAQWLPIFGWFGLDQAKENPSAHPPFLAALAANPTACLWHILNPTEFPRAPSA